MCFGSRLYSPACARSQRTAHLQSSSAAGKGFNIPGYQDPKLDDLLVQGQSASDLETRKAVYKQLQQYTSDVLPYLFLWYPQEIDVLSTALQGVPELGLRDAMHYIGEWWLAKK